MHPFGLPLETLGTKMKQKIARGPFKQLINKILDKHRSNNFLKNFARLFTVNALSLKTLVQNINHFTTHIDYNYW